MEQYYELCPVPENRKAIFAGSFLRNHAAMWWQTQHEQLILQPADVQWDLFKQTLQAQFQPVNSTKTARTRLDQLKQKTSVRIYNTEFRELMVQLPDMHEEDRIHTYLRGLKAHVASQVAMQQPATLLQAQGLADTADVIQFQYQARPQIPYTARRHTRPETQGPTPMDLDAIGKLTDAERDRLRKIGGCFRCRKTGHLARDCTLTNRTHPQIHVIDEEPDLSGKD
jgi:recombinational DNA repair protein RecR